MGVKKDDEGYTFVAVEDVIAVLAKVPKGTQVVLDKDGWMDDEIPHESAEELVEKRGVFQYEASLGCLVINN